MDAVTALAPPLVGQEANQQGAGCRAKSLSGLLFAGGGVAPQNIRIGRPSLSSVPDSSLDDLPPRARTVRRVPADTTRLPLSESRSPHPVAGGSLTRRPRTWSGASGSGRCPTGSGRASGTGDGAHRRAARGLRAGAGPREPGPRGGCLPAFGPDRAAAGAHGVVERVLGRVDTGRDSRRLADAKRSRGPIRKPGRILTTRPPVDRAVGHFVCAVEVARLLLFPILRRKLQRSKER